MKDRAKGYLTKDEHGFISFFKKMGNSRPLFSLFSCLQYTVDSKQMFNINKFLPMTGFKL